ncbi:MAG: hypothetical protein IKM85_06695 [Bacteroidales bacterium]|nr:hypothetical protein [Bacteroidales bacterium]
MSENPENTNKPKSETVKIDGISAQINLSPGSETHRRFAQLMREAGAATARAFIETLMDAYQNPPEDADSAATIIAMDKQIGDLKGEIAAYEATQQNDKAEIEDLNKQLATARNEANDNAAKAQKIQTDTEGCIILKPNPVSAYFLNEMAEKEKTTPGKILERLFIDDLQNPRANNLPYTVSGSRIREVMDELKNNQNQPKPTNQ